MHYINKVNLANFADSFPHTLSGGMKQRVAIRARHGDGADILLMDEPFAALDALTRRKMQDELLTLWDETRFTVLFVTHSIPRSHQDRNANPAAVAASGPGEGRAEQRRAYPGRGPRWKAHPAHAVRRPDRGGEKCLSLEWR